jgi:TolB protein
MAGLVLLAMTLSALLRGEPAKAQATSTVTNPGRISFVSNRDGNSEIYAMNAATGTDLLRLTDNPADDILPSWSPDGQKIAFASTRDGNYEIYAMNADGTNPIRLTYDAPHIDAYPSWSPDGQKIAFASSRDGNIEIYTMNADGTNPVRLTNNPEAVDLYADWSPDGQKITFMSNRDGNFEIYAMNADGTGVLRLTDNPADDECPSWSPDGRKIAFASTRDGNREIYAMNADGTNPVRLTNNPADEVSPSWSPADTTPPVISVPAGITKEATGPTGATVVFDVTATDNVDQNVSVTCSPASGSTFKLGTTTVNCTAEDVAHNVANGSFDVKVVDTTAPVINDVSSDISAEATEPGGAHVSWAQQPTATDLVDGDNVTVTTEPASGSLFPIGTTPVTITAVDSHNNKASASFKVTVQDTTPPVISVPADITKEVIGPNGAVVNFEAAATDKVDGSVAVTCTPTSGSTFPYGTTTVDCSATDKAGNAASASFKVTVQDTKAPAVLDATLVPNPGAKVSRTAVVSAQFSEKVQYVNTSTFKLDRIVTVPSGKKGTVTKYEPVAATVSPASGIVDMGENTTLKPDQALPKGDYRVTITTGVQDMASNPLAATPYYWFFSVTK